MKKILVLLAAAVVLAVAGASWSDGSAAAADWSSSRHAPTAIVHAGYVQDTGWSCQGSDQYQVVNISPGYAYVCNLYYPNWRWALVHWH